METENTQTFLPSKFAAQISKYSFLRKSCRDYLSLSPRSLGKYAVRREPPLHTLCLPPLLWLTEVLKYRGSVRQM